jgi:hypothetical protein
MIAPLMDGAAEQVQQSPTRLLCGTLGIAAALAGLSRKRLSLPPTKIDRIWSMTPITLTTQSFGKWLENWLKFSAGSDARAFFRETPSNVATRALF